MDGRVIEGASGEVIDSKEVEAERETMGGLMVGMGNTVDGCESTHTSFVISI